MNQNNKEGFWLYRLKSHHIKEDGIDIIERFPDVKMEKSLTRFYEIFVRPYWYIGKYSFLLQKVEETNRDISYYSNRLQNYMKRVENVIKLHPIKYPRMVAWALSHLRTELDRNIEANIQSAVEADPESFDSGVEFEENVLEKRDFLEYAAIAIQLMGHGKVIPIYCHLRLRLGQVDEILREYLPRITSFIIEIGELWGVDEPLEYPEGFWWWREYYHTWMNWKKRARRR